MNAQAQADLAAGEASFEAYRRAVSETFVPLHAEPTLSFESFAFHLHSWDLGDLRISEVQATPHCVRRRREDGAKLYKVGVQVAGTSLLTQDGRTTRVAPGHFALYDTTRPYDLEFHDRYRMVVLMFPHHLLRLPPAKVSHFTARAISGLEGTGELLTTVITRLHADRGTGETSADDHLSDAVINLVAASLSGDPTYDPRRSTALTSLRQRAQAYIDCHLRDPHLDATAVAAAHHVSLRYLQKAFAAQSETVAAYIRNQRLAHCLADLADPAGRHTAAAVGARWGFTDPGHFSRLFRARYGLPPGEYRLQAHPSSTGHDSRHSSTKDANRPSVCTSHQCVPAADSARSVPSSARPTVSPKQAQEERVDSQW